MRNLSLGLREVSPPMINLLCRAEFIACSLRYPEKTMPTVSSILFDGNRESTEHEENLTVKALFSLDSKRKKIPPKEFPIVGMYLTSHHVRMRHKAILK